MAPPVFKYKSPVPRSSAGIRFEPTFLSGWATDKDLARARNSEVPAILQVAGEMTAQEDSDIQYTRLKSKEPIYVGKEGQDVYKGTYLDEKAVFELPTARSNMEKLRKILLKRGTGNCGDRSEMENILSGQASKDDGSTSRRSYVLGGTITPDETRICAAAVNTARLRNQDRIAEVARLIAAIAVEVAEAYVPDDVLEMLKYQADIDVPITFGSENNKYFTTTQLNFSDGGETSLELTLGQAGALHVDYRDDPRRYTVLISLSRNQGSCWPGRTMITALRAYAVMAPFTILIFKATFPHPSLGPMRMDETRRPCMPTHGIQYLDPKDYVYARLMVVNYPKRMIMEKTPLLAHNKTAALLHGPEGLDSGEALALPAAQMVFGTLQNQWEFLARAHAWRIACQAKLNPVFKPASAAQIVFLYQWIEEGVDQTPRLEVIDAVLRGNSDTDKASAGAKKAWVAFTRRCEGLLSQTYFAQNKKRGDLKWVEQSEIGSTFDETSPMMGKGKAKTKSKKMSDKDLYGEKPYACHFCLHRDKTLKALKVHRNATHLDFEWFDPHPTPDPDRIVLEEREASDLSKEPLTEEQEEEIRKEKKRKLDDNREIPTKAWNQILPRKSSGGTGS